MSIRTKIEFRCDHCGHTEIGGGFTAPDAMWTVHEMSGVSHYCKKHGDWDWVLENIHDPQNCYKQDKDFMGIDP